MRLAVRYAEVAFFLTAAVALHVLFFLREPERGEIAGGAGGDASVSFLGADADVAEMVAEWETAPDAPAEVEKMEQPAPPEAPELDTIDMAPSPPMETPPPEPLRIDRADAPTPQTETPDVTTTDIPPPDAIAAPPPPELQPLAGLNLPASATPAPPPPPPPPQPAAMSVAKIEDVAVEPPMPEDTLAPREAPQPPKKPRTERQVARKQHPQPQPQRAPAPAKSQDEPSAPPSQVAAGSGGDAVEGAGTSDVSVGASAERKADLRQRWGGQIQREVSRRATKPRAIRRAGKTLVDITVSRDGALVSASLRHGSGSDGLDKAALKAIRAAAPFPPAPAELTEARYVFTLPVLFKR